MSGKSLSLKVESLYGVALVQPDLVVRLTGIHDAARRIGEAFTTVGLEVAKFSGVLTGVAGALLQSPHGVSQNTLTILQGPNGPRWAVDALRARFADSAIRAMIVAHLTGTTVCDGAKGDAVKWSILPPRELEHADPWRRYAPEPFVITTDEAIALLHLVKRFQPIELLAIFGGD
jgi:hypothetical protein